MKTSWLHRKGRDRLLVFCSGWGMDPEPFRELASSERDVLMFYDYRGMDTFSGAAAEIDGYSERILLGWSMGVWCGQRLFGDMNHLFSRSVAVNGTLCPVDDTFGIPRQLFAGTMHRWSPQTRDRFYHRMCRDPEVLKRFLARQPVRGLGDQQAELAYFLKTVDCVNPDHSIYREILITEGDRIVPTAHQLAYWGRARVTMMAGSHFPFYRWNSWDELLERIQGGDGVEM